MEERFRNLTLGDHQYQSLSTSTSIRLLRVDFTEDDYRYSLVETDISSTPPYVAISYVWGDPTVKHQVTLSSGTVGITESLHVALIDALSALRRTDAILDGREDISNESSIHIWADGLCINQQDIQEKNIQVPLMTTVYSTALAVVTYMGPEADNSEKAIDLLEKVTKYLASDHSNSVSIFSPEYNLCEYGIPPNDDLSWKALRMLLRRAWSTRIWILQEFVANSKIVLLCGSRVLPDWSDIWLMIGACWAKRLPEDLIREVIDEGPRDEYGPSCIAHLSFLRYTYQDDCKSLPLRKLLRYSGQLQSTDPKDKIFALLSMALDNKALGIQVDYSTTAENVYTMTTVRIIEHEKNFDVLSSVRAHPDCRYENLPSWVTNWSQLDLGNHDGVLKFKSDDDYTDFEASGKCLVSVSFDAAYTALTTRGMIVDTLIIVNHNRRSLRADYWNCIEQHVLDTGNTVYHTVDGIRAALRRTLIYDTDPDGVVLTPSSECGFDVCWVDDTSKFAMFSPEEQSLAVGIESTIEDTSNGRPFGVTSKGYICVPCDGMEPGDVIAVLRGGRVPYALRRTDGGKYLFIGELYVQGLMRGEALSLGDLSEEITLV